MAIIWANRADNASFNARYSAAGLSASTANVGVAISYDTDAGALVTGHNINMDNGSGAVKYLSYPGRGVFSNQAFSINILFKMITASNCPVFEIATGSSTPSNYYAMWISSAGLWKVIIKNQTGQVVANSVNIYNVLPTLDTWYDATLTWDGTTGANKIILYLNGVSVGTATGAFAASNPKNPQNTDYIAFGNMASLATTRLKYQEMTIWDTEINPTTVVLDSGTGLTGPTRTSPITVATFDGSANTNPGIANVASTTSYTIAGVSYTGTLVSSTGGYKYI